MNTLKIMIKRNIKAYFKDPALFWTSLITPLILLLLYITFLGNVYRMTLTGNFPEGVVISESLIDGLVGGQLFSSLLAVCCVTVAFCSNMLMVQDKVSGAHSDMMITPVNRSTLALAYYISSAICTLIICFVATGACFIYLGIVGFYIPFTDVLLLLLDVFIIVMFGTALSSVINIFLSTQGQISAVGSIVSSCYGFICGAYMPISSFSVGLQRVLGFLPGTYATSLLRNHAMNGVLAEMNASGLPQSAVTAIRDSVDCNIYFFGSQVSVGVMYAVVVGTVALLIGVFVLINVLKNKK